MTMTALWLLVKLQKRDQQFESLPRLGCHSKDSMVYAPRIRLAMQTGSFLNSVEKLRLTNLYRWQGRNMHIDKKKRKVTGRGPKDKTTVMGSWSVRRNHNNRRSNRKKKVLQKEIKKHVQAGTALYSDALKSYEGLDARYAHQVIDHAVAYVTVKFTQMDSKTFGVCLTTWP